MPDSTPPDGLYRGTFCYHGEPAAQPLAVAMRFRGDRIEGAGRDAAGDYRVEGTWHASTRGARWRKRYAGGETALYHARWDAGAGSFAGRWKLLDEDTGGAFALSPEHAAATAGPTAAAPRTRRADLAGALFEGDRETRATLLADTAFARVLDEARRARDPWAERRRLGMTGVRLTPAVAPALNALAARAAATLGIVAPVDLVCVQEAAPTAFVLRADDGRVTLGFNAWVLERLADEELLFVLGHELGHVAFEHDLIPPSVVGAVREAPTVAPLTAMRLHAWFRYAEVSADRLGLLCCGDLRAALNALFKVSSGLWSPRYALDPAAVQGLFDAAHEDWNGSESEDWYTTHPFAPLRLRGLSLFARSAAYHRLAGRPGGVEEAVTEADTRALLGMMEPSFLHEEGSGGREAKAFLALGGAHVAMSDGRVVKAERALLAPFFAGASEAGSVTEALALPPAARRERLCALADVLCVRLPVVRRIRLLEDLAIVARADRRVSAREREALADLAFLLDVEGDAVEALAGEARAAMD